MSDGAFADAAAVESSTSSDSLRDRPLPYPLVMEETEIASLKPEQLDGLLNLGWRHFGRTFFRYSLFVGQAKLRWVQPVRVDLPRCELTASQRRIRRRNADLAVRAGPAVLDAEREAVFRRHRTRFEEDPPPSLAGYLGDDLAAYPCSLVEITARLGGRLVAASYLDVGRECVSSVYAIFEPEFSVRSLGIATMIWEMDEARRRGARYYHPGYAFHDCPSMDYKKQFRASEWFDWQSGWRSLERPQRR